MTEVNEELLCRVLYNHFSDRGYAVFTQVPAPAEMQGGRRVSRVIDLVAVRLPDAERPGGTVAVEVKCQRKDFLADVATPEKQAPWVALASEHYFAAPSGVVRLDDLPAGSGLFELHHPGDRHDSTEWALDRPMAAHARPGPVPAWLMNALLQRAAAMEAFHAAWLPTLDGVDQVHVEIEKVRRELAASETKVARAQEATEAWKMLAARQGHKVPCATCGFAIVPTRISAGVPAGWRHAQTRLTADCPGNTRGIRPREEAP